MAYPVGVRTKMKGHPGIYVYAGKGKVNGIQPLTFYFTFQKSGYVKVGTNLEGYSIEDAKTKRSEYIRAVRHGEAPVVTSSNHTFGAEFERFLAHVAVVTPTQIMKDRYAYRQHLKKAFGKRPVVSINKNEILFLMATLEKSGLSSSTRSGILGAIKRFYMFLLAEGARLLDPTIGVTVKSTAGNKERYLDLGEIDSMLDLCDKHGWSEARAMILLGVEMGLRRSEMFTSITDRATTGSDRSLMWERINFTTGNVTLFRKGGKYHTLPMTPRIREALVALGPKASGPVFTKSQHQRIQQIISMLGFNKGLDYKNPEDRVRWVSVHTLRHTFGSWLAMRTKDLLLVSKLMGHNHVMTTTLYAHLINGELDNAMEDFGKFMGSSEAHPDKVVPLRKRA